MITGLGRIVGAVLGTILHVSLMPVIVVLHVVVRIVRLRMFIGRHRFW